MLGLGVLGAAEDEHLHLRELMHAVEALALASGGSRLRTEAVGDAGELERQLLFLEDRIRVHAAQGDLGGADQTEVVIRHGVDLGLFAARAEAQPLDDRGAGEVRGDDRDEAFGQELVEGEALETDLEHRGFPLQVVELLAGHLRGPLEVDQVEVLGEGEVIPGLEVEAAGRAHGLEGREVLFPAAGRFRVEEVGQRSKRSLELRLCGPHRFFLLPDLFLESTTLCGVGLARRVVELLLAGLLMLVAQAVRFVELRAKNVRLLLQRDCGIDVGAAVSCFAALDDLVAAVLEARGSSMGA